MPERVDDITLQRECIRGSREAWDIFVQQYSRLVYHAIRTTLLSHSYQIIQEDIEDIYSGLFLSLIEDNYKKLRQFEGRNQCKLSSWVRMIAVRRTIDFLRAQKPQASLNEENDSGRSLMETVPDHRMSVDDQMELSESERLVQEAIQELSTSDRLFMKLYYEEELAPEQIAGIMKISASAVYSRKTRVREKLKKILKERGMIA